MQHFCHTEELNDKNQYICQNCGISDAQKRLTIEQGKVLSSLLAPRILLIHFMRFDAFGWKIDKYVPFPKRFNLRAFISKNIDEGKPKEHQTPYIYELYGVIVHSGVSVHGGHYYSYVKNASGDWYICNDEKVQKIEDVNRVLK